MNKKINVTQPVLPDLDEFTTSLKQIWENKWLTNNGPFHEQFEKDLADFLGVKYISLFTNGTLALITALQVLNITGEVITTPYSFVATTHALWWNNIKPVFVDIENQYCNIDPNKIESAITSKTTAILPVHVYGNPTNIEKIQEIADKHGLKVIYDAAHAFGINYKNQSVLNFGDLSILSFHATKAFNTIEGGAIVSRDLKTKQKIDYLKNFGFTDETTVVGPGINSKMNEIQAAYGILQLKGYNKSINKREKIANIYTKELQGLDGVKLLNINPDTKNYNYSYFPIFINKKASNVSRNELYDFLKKNNIYSRRYFYPLISHFPPYKEFESAKSENLAIAEQVANEVLCLPIYPDLDHFDVRFIVKKIKTVLK